MIYIQDFIGEVLLQFEEQPPYDEIVDMMKEEYPSYCEDDWFITDDENMEE